MMTIPYIAEEMAVATDKTRYKDVKVRIPEEELAVLNCRVAKQVCPENNISVA